MASFTVERRTTLTAAEAFSRVTAWTSHRPPFTRVRIVGRRSSGVGTRFVARTALGRWGFDDVMEVVEWRPPTPEESGYCRVVKVGRVVAGWAEITVRPEGNGAHLTWHEVAGFRHGGLLLDLPTKFAGRIVFGRLLDSLLSG